MFFENMIKKKFQSALFRPLGRWAGNNFLFKGGLLVPFRNYELLKERSRPSVSNVTSADVRLDTTTGRGRHWLTSRNQSVNRTDWSTEIIQRNG